MHSIQKSNIQKIVMTEIATQRTKILEYLMQGFTMTGLDGLRVAGTMKLATRVGELIKAGHPIIKEWITTTGEKPKRIMSYKMDLSLSAH